MARDKATKKTRKRARSFEKLPYSEHRGNALQFINQVCDRIAARVIALRREKGQPLDSCEGVW